jgi:hypothetical protein
MSSITLNQAVIAPLRNALYSQLAVADDALEVVLVLPERERNPRVRDTYRALCAAGRLLDAIGWQEQDSKDTLTISSAGEVRLILYALEVEWGVETDQADTARSFGEARSVAAAERRCAAVRDAAHAVETAASVAGLLEPERS